MRTIDKKIPIYVLHVLGSLLFISIPVFSSPDFNTSGHLFDIAAFQRNFLSHILLLAFFYTNYLYLLPRFYFTKKHISYCVCIALFLGVIIFLPLLLISDTMPLRPAMPSPHIIPGTQIPLVSPMITNGPLFSFLLVFFLGFLLKINQRLDYMQNEKLKAEIAYLRAQINPHFLFNTLNSVYALALEKSDFAPEAILKLSSMMRYVVTESSRDTVSLEKEIEYIKNYINLQRLRMDEAAALSFTVTGSPIGKDISPLLIIPFIENAFKYGFSPEEESRIAINIDVSDDELKLTVENKKVTIEIPHQEKIEQGIENTRQRLQYLYPDKHKLTIFDKEQLFTVNLSITLV